MVDCMLEDCSVRSHDISKAPLSPQTPHSLESTATNALLSLDSKPSVGMHHWLMRYETEGGGNIPSMAYNWISKKSKK